MDQEVFKILSNTYYQQNKDHIIELNKKYYREHIDEKKIYNKEYVKQSLTYMSLDEYVKQSLTYMSLDEYNEKHKKERKERNEKWRNENKTKIKIYNRKLVMAVNDGTNIVKFTF